MKILARLLGGSHLYGLNTPESDYDERFIYAYDDVPNIIGLDKNECISEQDKDQDKLGYELRRYLELLKKTNNQVVEYLFADESAFIEITPEFKLIRQNKFRLIDQDRFYKSLRGYIQNELKLANGERTGELGSKRKAALDKYGFSPKNFSHLLRLIQCGITFFKTGEYPVNLQKHNAALTEKLLKIKMEPGAFTKESLNITAKIMEELFVNAYQDRLTKDRISYYDHDVANDIIFKIYYPTLKEIYEKNSNV